MIRRFVFILMAFALTMCSEENIDENACSTRATVKDLTGLDGCGIVFELEDGTTLLPYRVFYCGTPPFAPNPEPDPLYNFELVDGMKVMIDYELMNDMASTCMAGPVAKITCMTQARQQWELSE